MRKNNRSIRGFTLMEMLIVVGIIAVILGVSFVAVVNYRRSMKQLELDETSRQIFIAAQNHLTMAKSQGTLDARESTPDVMGESHPREAADGKEVTYHYFFYNPKTEGASNPLRRGTVLYDMLPQYSLDDTVRTSGSYVIEYDFNSATVTNVFYSDQSDLSNVQFAASDYNALFVSDGGLTGDAKKDARLAGLNNESNKIVGWYGGETAQSLVRNKLYAPRVDVINEECLAVKVSFSATALNKMTKNSGLNAILQLKITGKTSGNTKVVNINAAGRQGEALSEFLATSKSEISGVTTRRYKGYILDDITQKNVTQKNVTQKNVTQKNVTQKNGEGHFANKWCQGSDALIPGEDITVKATVFSNSVLANISESAPQTTNSLFQTAKVAEVAPIDGSPQCAVEVKNIRHLENLDMAISGFDQKNLQSTATGVIGVTQLANMTWVDNATTSGAFLNKIYANSMREATESKKEDVTVTNLEGTAYKAGCYAPVNPTYPVEYNGSKFSISNAQVEVEGNAGLFGQMQGGSGVSDLEVLNCNATAKGNNNCAGALVGKTEGSLALQNVLVRDVPNSTASLVRSEGGHAGGLIGLIDASAGSATATMDGCEAAVFVSATGTAEGLSAGGLVGNAKGNVTIQNCSVGGHMTDGSFATNPNISAAQIAGGILGSGANTKIQNSYATCSINDQGTLGGIAGSLTNADVDNAYAACYVVKNEASSTNQNAEGQSIEDLYPTKGALVGTVDAATKFSDKCSYLQILNGDMPAIGTNSTNDSATATTPFDKNTKTYNAMYGEVKEDAVPYTTSLGTNYPYKTPFELSGEAASEAEGKWLTSHYGDWPDVETKVVNAKNSSAAPRAQALRRGYVPARTSFGSKKDSAVRQATIDYANARINAKYASNVNEFVTTVLRDWLQRIRSVLPSGSAAESLDDGESDGGDGKGAGEDASSKSDEPSSSSSDASSSSSSSAGADAANSSSSSDASSSSSSEKQETSQTPEVAPNPAPEAQDAAKAKNKPLEKTITSADGRKYTVRVSYDESAGIPDGTELLVTEINQRPADFYDEDKRETYQNRPLATELLVNTEEMQDRIASLTQALELKDGDLLMWNKLLSVNLTLDGETITPVGNVTVEIETNALEATASDTLEAVALSDGDPRRLSVVNTTGTAEGEAQKRAEELPSRITFTTNSLGDLGLAQVSEEKFAWQMQDNKAFVYGARSVVAAPSQMSLDLELPDGKHLVEVFSIAVDPTHAFDTTLWISATHTGGASNRSNVFGYRVTDGGLNQLFTTATADGLVPVVANDVIALVWDSGYRQAMYSDGDLTIVGEVPEGVTVSAQNVSGQYGDPTKLGVDANKPGTTVVGAYTIALKDARDADYVANDEHPVIANVANLPAQASEVSVWRVGQNGTTRVKSQKLDDGSVSFAVTGPGTYVVTYTIQTYQREVEGDGWKVSASYTEEAGIPADAEFVVRELSGAEYDAYIDQAAKALGKDPKDVKVAKAFDISFKKGDEEYHELNESVHIAIDLADQEVNSDTQVVHVDEKAEVKASDVENGVLSFNSSEFSPFLLLQSDGDGITLHFVNGENEVTASVVSGQPIGQDVIPTEPTKEGYTLGWYVVGSDTPITAESTFEAETNLYPRYTYTVTFEAEGVENPPAAIEVFEGQGVGTLPTVSKPGYRFDGWFNGENKVEDNAVLTGHTTLTAHFVEQVTVTFVADGESRDVKVDKGTAIGDQLPDGTKEGCTFVGWFIDDTETKVEASTIFNDNAAATARYTVDVTFAVKNADYSQTTSETPETINKGDAIGSKIPGDPVLQGYAFKGWFLEGQDGKPTGDAITAQTTFSSNTRLVAKFVKRVTIAFYDRNGDTTVLRQSFTVDQGETVNLIDNPNKEGYRFDGWFEGTTRRTNDLGITDPAGNLIDATGNPLPEGASPVRYLIADRDMNLVSEFVEQITVHFLVVDFVNTSDSTGLPSVNVHNHAVMDKTAEGLAVSPFPTNPAMSGYEFQGWYRIKQYPGYDHYGDIPQAERKANNVFVLDKSENGIPYVLDENTPVSSTDKYTSSTDVMAKFVKELNVTFQYDGKQANVTYLSGDALDDHIPADAAKAGYRLEWYRGDTKVPDGYTVKDEDDNAIFTARYIEQATITFKVGDTETGTLTVDKGTSVQASGKDWPADPSNPDTTSSAVFIGWYDANNHEYKAESLITTNSLELTVQFGYTVNFFTEDNLTEPFTTPRKVQANTALSWLPTAPYKQGKSFKEWRIGTQVIDETYAVTSNTDIVAYYEDISIYTVTINYAIGGVASDTKILTLDKSAVSTEKPEIVTSPSSFSKADGIYYPVMQELQIVPDGNTLGVKDKHAEVTVVENPASNITITVPYKKADSRYTVRYMLKDLAGENYTQIESKQLDGVLGASVSPEVKEYDYAELERVETGAIQHSSGDVFNVYYTRKYFTLSYDAKGGQVVDSVSERYGTTIKPLPTPTREGYTFDGWYRNANYTGQKVNQQNGITLNGDTTLYAKWTAKTVNYTIVYMLEKYDNATDTTSFVYDSSRTASGQVGTEVVATNAPNISGTRNGYEKDNAQNANSKITITPDGSAVLQVYYKLIRYTIVFNINRNSGRITMNGQTYTGSNYRIENVVLGQDMSDRWPATLSEIYDTQSGNNLRYFRYWTGASGNYVTKRYELIWDNVSNANSSHVMTYTANWATDNYNRNAEYWLQQPDGTYKVEDSYTQIGLNTNSLGAKDIDGYTKNGGDGRAPAGYSNSGYSTITEEVLIPAQKAYVYARSYLGEQVEYQGYTWVFDYEEDGYYYYSRITVPEHYETQTKTVYVNYRFYYNRTKYKIDYYYGTTKLTTKENIFFEADISGSTYNYQPNRPTGVDNDYTWDGWFSDSECTTPFTFTTMPAHNVALYTKWHAPSFTVTFHLNYDGASPEPYFQRDDVEKYRIVTDNMSEADLARIGNPAPAPAHYTFTNWYTQPTGGEIFDPAGKSITQNTDVYAHWKPKGISYTVKYLKTGTTEEILPTKTVTGNLTVGQEVTELAPYVTGYHLSDEDPSVTMVADVGSKTITLDYENNEIIFYYGKKPEKVKYTVKYVLYSDKVTNVADSVTKEVPGSYTSVTETAATPTVDAYKDYYPTEITKSLSLGHDENQNVLTFYYTKGAKLTVSYVDMEGDPIPGKSPIETYQEVGQAFDLDTALPGYTFARTEKNGELTTDTSFTPTKNTEVFDIKVYYKYNLSILARSRSRVYNGEALTDAGTYNNASDFDSLVSVSGLKDGHALTSITISGSQTDAGTSPSSASDAVITGFKNGMTAATFYNISYPIGSLTVTPINVSVSLEPDRWTGNIYDGTVKMTGFTNSTKAVDSYIKIDNNQFKADHLNSIWDDIKTYLKANAGAEDYGKLLNDVDGLAVIKGKKDVGDYYEPAGTFEAALANAISNLNLGNNYKIIQYARECHLEILPLPVNIKTGAAQKSYDGTPLTNPELTITISPEAGQQTVLPEEGTTDKFKLTKDGNLVTIKTSGSQTAQGTSLNTYTIDWGSDNAENFSVTEDLGELKVEKRTIIIDVQDDVKPYKLADPAPTVKVYYETTDDSGNTSRNEIPATLTHWSGDNYTIKLNDDEHGYIDNLPITITRVDKSEKPGKYEVKADAGEGAEENYNIEFESGWLTIAIARVSQNGGAWTYHEYLVNDKGTGNQQGAFDLAKTLDGKVILETLCETALVDGEAQDRYALPAGQSVKAGQDLTIRTTQHSTWNPSGNGHFQSIISRVTEGYQNSSMITLNQEKSSLTVKDIILDGGSQNGNELSGAGDAVSGGAINALKGTSLLLQNVIVRNSDLRRTNNEKNANGGGIYGGKAVNSIVMNDVTLEKCNVFGSGNKGISGGGAYLEGKATVNCITVTDCHADSDKGGGVYFFNTGSSVGTWYEYKDENNQTQRVDKPSVFTNCSAKRGGAINFYESGGTIAGTQDNRVRFINCTANGDIGGAVTFSDEKSSFTNVVRYADFIGCSTTKSGGAINVAKQKSEISNVSIVGCTANESGGGIYLGSTSTITDVYVNGQSLLLQDGATNAANGGGIYANGGTLTLKGEALIQNCVASNGGGGIYVNKAKLMMKDDTPSITGCKASIGGAIMANGSSADVQIALGIISDNEATGLGGGALRLEGGANAKVSGTAQIVGNKVTGSGEKYGGAINIKQGKLTVEGGNISNNTVEAAGREGAGGAIHVSGYLPVNNCRDDNGELVITGGTIISNAVRSNQNVYGGAISFRGSTAKASISGGTIEENGIESTASNKNALGGAICVRDGGELTLTGGTFNNNTAISKTDGSAKGAGIYVDNTEADKVVDDATEKVVAKLKISGEPTFGAGSNANTVTLSDYADKKNGGEEVYGNNQVRQDIFIPEAPQNPEDPEDPEEYPQSIEITGDLTGSNGTIWVWAESEYRYKQLMPFATMSEGVVFGTASGNLNPDHLKVFRDARDDEATENETETYLFGTNEGEREGYAYWSGISGRRKVILQKVGENNLPLEGAQLTVFRGNAATPLIVKVTEGDTSTEQPLVNLPSTKSGVFWIGELTYGTYYLQETKAPNDSYSGNEHKWYCLIVNDAGAFMSKDGYINAEEDATAKVAALKDATAVWQAATT